MEKIKRLLLFDLSKYSVGYITESSNGMNFTFGRLSYFVIKDDNGRFGKFRSFMTNKTMSIDYRKREMSCYYRTKKENCESE